MVGMFPQTSDGADIKMDVSSYVETFVLLRKKWRNLQQKFFLYDKRRQLTPFIIKNLFKKIYLRF